MHVLPEQLRNAADEGRHAANDFIQDDAEGVNVGLRSRDLARKDFRGHVQRGADDAREVARARDVDDAGDSEVDDARGHRRRRKVEQDIGGLDVAVKDACAVDGAQPFGDRSAELRGFRGRQRPRFFEVSAQVAAGDVVHDQRERRPFDDEVVDADDVRRRHAQKGRPLLDEALDEAWLLGEVGPKDFEGVDLGHGVLRALAGSTTDPHLSLGALPNALIEDVSASKPTHVPSRFSTHDSINLQVLNPYS